MAKRVFAGRGAHAVKDTSVLADDLIGMSDEEKRRKRQEETEANVSRNQKRIKAGKKAVSLTEHDLDQFRSRKQKLRRQQTAAAKARTSAAEVERSGTGNKAAAATYREVARIRLAKAAALRKDAQMLPVSKTPIKPRHRKALAVKQAALAEAALELKVGRKQAEMQGKK